MHPQLEGVVKKGLLKEVVWREGITWTQQTSCSWWRGQLGPAQCGDRSRRGSREGFEYGGRGEDEAK